MPRVGARKTLATAGTGHGTGVTVESAAAAASVDIPDATLTTTFGIVSDELSDAEFADDYKLSRVPIAVAGDEAALTIGIAAVVRDDTNNKFVVHFTATAAASKKVGIRVTAL